MTRATPETQPNDHENGDFAMLIGPQYPVPVENLKLVRKEIRAQMDMFDYLWTTVRENLQQPVYDDSEQLRGYAPHRIVAFQDEMGRCALSFFLKKTGSDLYRSISAYRRKMYDDDKVRTEYLSDDMYLCMEEIRSHQPFEDAMYAHRLGVLAVWINKYLAAEPYEPLPSYADEIV